MESELEKWLAGRIAIEKARRKLKETATQNETTVDTQDDPRISFWAEDSEENKLVLRGQVNTAINQMAKFRQTSAVGFTMPLVAFGNHGGAYVAALRFREEERRFGTKKTTLYGVAPALLRWFLKLHDHMTVQGHPQNLPISFAPAEFGRGGSSDPAGPVTGIGCVFLLN